MSRLCATCAAATNCPRFLKPAACFCRSVPAGNSACSDDVRFVLRESWSPTVGLPVLVLASCVDASDFGAAADFPGLVGRPAPSGLPPVAGRPAVVGLPTPAG